jgi:4-hydroxy-2-oxoheptanedioate aldolase
MYKTEKLLFKQLKILKKEYNIFGIKAEFEAEGSSYRDLNRLSRICLPLDVPLYLKIGGPEAVRDIKDSLDLGVAGLIAPMIESKFAAKKFIEAYKKIYQDAPINTSLNIETKTGIENIKEIVDYAAGSIDNITIGRSDLSGSFFEDGLIPDSNFILNSIESIAPIVHSNNMTLTVGGKVTQKTIEAINKNFPNLKQLITKLETRKVMFLTNDLINQKGSVTQALKFEELYILSKKEYSDMYIDSEISRLTELSRRTGS